MGGELNRILEDNAAYAATFGGKRLVRPRRRLAVVACMDSRIDVFAMLGLAVGDAHVIRNAGGVVTDDVIRSLCISQRALGTREIVLVHHTDCGLEGVVDDEFVTALQNDVGAAPAWSVGGFDDVYEDVRESLRRIAETPFIPYRDRVSGFVFDVASGELTRVE